MLKDGLAYDPALVPFLVFGFFCGIRPMDEVCGLRWRNVSITDKVVTIPAEISKTKTRRFIDLSENAIAWLKLASTLPPKTLVVPFGWDELREKREALWKRVAPRKAWVHQGM